LPPDIILAFDTSAAHCAAALLLPDGRCLITDEAMAKGQAERLVPMIEELLHRGQITFRDLTAIGVGTGPGNFTGVRISVALARGLALSLGVPAIGVTRLEALAYALPRPVTVVDDARRDAVYVQRFDTCGADQAAVLATDIVQIDGPVTGPGAALIGRVALEQPVPLVQAIARIAAGRTGTPHPPPAPFYLRGADAAPPSDPAPVILDA